jgi:hypothetical protein
MDANVIYHLIQELHNIIVGRGTSIDGC